ncbi:APC family permease [Aurantimicrobium sp. MWH-Uga1]|uniref:APC family permease n=1 Tax=Aurantimicrobium sp. MWH-Uga1 TaxID=2079575 RepID=UPI000DED4E97|nr:amino acid permease [Aurantimicrobium sp. MWH-Uga1]AXE55178.1 putative amino acid permease YhdG [Aurantimicrobium sp. MWH-Uga1]
MIELRRAIRLPGAVALGLGSMIGAGVFSAFAPAAQSAGVWLLLSLCLAALAAWLNASSSAQLAAQFPTSGGTYAFGREMLGPWWGYLAGWSFVIGKLASSAAIALTLAAYLLPEEWQRPGAILAVATLTLVNMRGITRTIVMAVALMIPVVMVLLAFISFGILDRSIQSTAAAPADIYGITQAAGLLFFAFAGYARLATLGEEVVQPIKTIPRAIMISLVIAFLIYMGVGWSLLELLGPQKLASSTRPLLDALEVAGLSSWSTAIVMGAALACAGSLLALIAGISRTLFAMGRNKDVPQWLAEVHPRFHVPHRAELLVGIIVIVVVSSADIRGAIGFSSAGVLFYYFVTNLSALKQDKTHRLYPRFTAIAGALVCALLVVTLPPTSLIVAGTVLVCGVILRMMRIRRR